jgi:hypothetical protein
MELISCVSEDAFSSDSCQSWGNLYLAGEDDL